MSTIITPTHAIFKEGEVYVYTLPEEPKQVLQDDWAWRNKWGAIVEKEWDDYNQTCTYARAHPIKVDEKDKEKVKTVIFEKHASFKGNQLLKQMAINQWQPQDLTEYKIEEVRMEIKDIVNRYNPLAPRQQVACLIEDDKAESHSSKVLDSLLGEITPEEQDTTDKMMIDKAKSHDLWMEVCEIISSHTGVESVSEILNKGFKIVRR